MAEATAQAKVVAVMFWERYSVVVVAIRVFMVVNSTIHGQLLVGRQPLVASCGFPRNVALGSLMLSN